MRDSFGRTIDYLRLSVTERCDLRCRYCMEEAGVPKRSHAEMLTLEELAEIGGAAVALGVRKIRLTGGEPLVRRGLLDLCRSLSALPGLSELCLTTNGAQLARFAAPLRAAGEVRVSKETLTAIREGKLKKGDVLAVAQVAGIQAAKHCWELIPMCHPVPLTGVDIRFSISEDPCRVEILAEVSCAGPTGVEMEALTAVSAAALTVYDMCKALQRDMRIEHIRLLAKSGGRSGDFRAEEGYEWQS